MLQTCRQLQLSHQDIEPAHSAAADAMQAETVACTTPSSAHTASFHPCMDLTLDTHFPTGWAEPQGLQSGASLPCPPVHSAAGCGFPGTQKATHCASGSLLFFFSRQSSYASQFDSCTTQSLSLQRRWKINSIKWQPKGWSHTFISQEEKRKFWGNAGRTAMHALLHQAWTSTEPGQAPTISTISVRKQM